MKLDPKTNTKINNLKQLSFFLDKSVNIIMENITKTKDKIAPLLIKSKIDNKDE